MLCEPLAGLAPLQPPPAVHEDALGALQRSCALAPLATDSGVAASVVTGTTATVALAVTGVPPVPAQVSE